MERGLLVLDAETVASALRGRERDVIERVRAAYVAHRAGDSVLPHSMFLRFPDQPRDRIIALPAYLGGEQRLAGIKWIASFPGNVADGGDRASAVLVLNSADTGYPYAMLEASHVSAQRTAASAALAADRLWPAVDRARLTIVGCGLIAHECLRYLLAIDRPLASIALYDTDESSARAFARRVASLIDGITVTVETDRARALRQADVLLLATTAGTPHIADPSLIAPGATVLHVSLRDLSPEVMLTADNLVDDVDHVARAETSIHLTEKQTGGRAFIRGTLADVVNGTVTPRSAPGATVIFSPFGLGVLDLAVGDLVVDTARANGSGVRLPEFLPRPWREESAAPAGSTS